MLSAAAKLPVEVVGQPILDIFLYSQPGAIHQGGMKLMGIYLL